MVTLSGAGQSVEILEIKAELRTQRLQETRDARLLSEASRAKTERLISANKILEDRDSGFGDTVVIISGIAPSEVTVTSIDDDGQIVAVAAESADYPEMLAYVRLLEDVPQFEHVQVLSLTRSTSGGMDSGQQDGGAMVIETLIKASLVITRIEIDESQILSNQELALVTD